MLDLDDNNNRANLPAVGMLLRQTGTCFSLSKSDGIQKEIFIQDALIRNVLINISWALS
jgi:hypothetical protein